MNNFSITTLLEIASNKKKESSDYNPKSFSPFMIFHNEDYFKPLYFQQIFLTKIFQSPL